MLKFHISVDSAGAAGSDAPVAATTEDWRDETGKLIASVRSSGGYYRFEVPGTAVFVCAIDVGTVTAIPLGNASTAFIRDIFYRSILPFLLHALGFEGLHAAAIVVSGRVYAFCAPSGTGKSTLVDGFQQRGYAIWADDCLILRPAADPVATLPVPFHIRLAKTGPPWANRYGPAIGATVPESFDPDNALTMPLGALLMMDRRPDLVGPAQLQTLSPGDTIRQLLTHAYAFSGGTPERRRHLMDHFLTVAATVPAYRLELPDDTGQIDAVLDYLEPLLAFSAEQHNRDVSARPMTAAAIPTGERDRW